MAGDQSAATEPGLEPPRSYADYLALDQLLSAQRPLTGAHDELLFIVQHQTAELWLKLLLHELTSVRALLRADTVPLACRRLERSVRILQQLNAGWEVLRSLDPAAFARLREALGRASGFQSLNWRRLEFLLGNREAALGPDRYSEAEAALLREMLAEPSLYEAVLDLLARQGRVTGWRAVYRDTAAEPQLHELGERLLDLEDAIRLWRLQHLLLVERLIGGKRGTGGSSGVDYLRRLLDVTLFPDLRAVRDGL